MLFTKDSEILSKQLYSSHLEKMNLNKDDYTWGDNKEYWDFIAQSLVSSGLIIENYNHDTWVNHNLPLQFSDVSNMFDEYEFDKEIEDLLLNNEHFGDMKVKDFKSILSGIKAKCVSFLSGKRISDIYVTDVRFRM